MIPYMYVAFNARNCGGLPVSYGATGLKANIWIYECVRRAGLRGSTARSRATWADGRAAAQRSPVGLDGRSGEGDTWADGRVAAQRSPVRLDGGLGRAADGLVGWARA